MDFLSLETKYVHIFFDREKWTKESELLIFQVKENSSLEIGQKRIPKIVFISKENNYFPCFN